MTTHAKKGFTAGRGASNEIAMYSFTRKLAEILGLPSMS
jgi:hypothetical protein